MSIHTSYRSKAHGSNASERRKYWANVNTPASSVSAAIGDRVSAIPAQSKWHQGIQVTKVDKNGKSAKRYLTISKDKMAIYCTHESIAKFMDKGQSSSFGFAKLGSMTSMLSLRGGGHADAGQRHIDVADLVDVSEGLVGTYKLEKSRNESRLKGIVSDIDIHREQIVCITHHGNSTLNVLVEDSADRKTLVEGLRQMKEEYELAKQGVDNEALLLRYTWYDIDVNKDNKISEKEFTKIIQRINIDLKNPSKFFRQFIKEHHITSKELKFPQVMLLLQTVKAELSTGEISASEAVSDNIWNKHFGADKKVISAEEFLYKFLHTTQKETEMSLLDVKKLFDHINDMEVNREEDDFPEDHLSRFRFELYLKSDTNQAFDPVSQEPPKGPLDKPMSQYWINTSHNTYLLGDQLQSSSSVEMYMRSLRRGCKCLELDCWDGEAPEDTNNETIPVVFHGHTITSKIAFVEILHGVKAYLDDHPETYPIILSLENHCSHPFQAAMAKNMKDVFGDKLYIPPKDISMEDLPSPESLKGMIVIKGKRPPAPDDAAPEAEDDTDPYSHLHEMDAANVDTTGAAGTEAVKNAKPPKIVAELAELTLFHGTSFKSFDESIQLPPSHMHSIGETKIPKLIKTDVENAKMWRKYNQRHMTRTYPAGVRVDSSNYNPMLAWSVGSQLVALNFQTPDENLVMNDGRFRVSGGCGYLLKPASVMGTAAGVFPQPIDLSIRVILGSCLPKPFGNTTGEIIDPYVNVSLHDIKEGSGVDTNYELAQDSQMTEFVDNNGFCPVFEKTFKFKVHSPDCAIVCFNVQEKDVAMDDKVGHSAIPFSCLRRGFRSVPLYDNHNTRSGAFGYASLFVEINF